jgi:hypothetical protein
MNSAHPDHIPTDVIESIREKPFAATIFLEEYSPNARTEDGSTLMDLSLAGVADLVSKASIENTRYSNLVRRFIEVGSSPTPAARESAAVIYARTDFETNPDDLPWERDRRDLREHRALVHANRLLEVIPFAPYQHPRAAATAEDLEFPEPPLAPHFAAEQWPAPDSPVDRRGYSAHLFDQAEPQPKIKPGMLRALSAELSPRVVAGFDLDGLRSHVSKQLGKTFLRPLKDFPIHKDDTRARISPVVETLCIYGEIDRAAAGLRPLLELPAETYWISANMDYADAAAALVYFAALAGRTDLVVEFDPLAASGLFRPANDPADMLRWEQYLPLEQRKEAVDRSAPGEPRGDLAPNLLRSLSGLLRVWVHGRSPLLSRQRCVFEIDSIIKELFSLPGYAPWSESAYPYPQDGLTA